MAYNLNFLKNIEGTNINVPKMKNVLLCPKASLNMYRNMLQLALEKNLEDFYGSPLQMVSQVQNQMSSFVQNSSLMSRYDGGVPYISPVEAWINEACQSNPSPWHQFQVFQVHTVIQRSFPILMQILVGIQLIMNVILLWNVSKDKGKGPGMDCLLSWLHWWYDFT